MDVQGLDAKLGRQPAPLVVAEGLALVGLVGVVDLLSGYEVAFSLFYVIPISFAAWLAGRQAGLAVSLSSALVWLWADIASGHAYAHPFIPAWNTLIRLSFFVIITMLLAALRASLDREWEQARTDSLTGAANSRSFHELARMEIERSRRYRHPFTVAYIDLDNFKEVNDRFGHSVGDEAIRAVVALIGAHVRKTDVVARLGGDEVALLLPETGEEVARAAVAKLQGALLYEMRRRGWPVTFSIGVLTCLAPPPTTDQLVRMADELMYAVKRTTKNAVRYETYAG